MLCFLFSFSFTSWRRTCTPLLGITSWHKWWASLLNALQLWLRAACIVGRTNEGSDLPRGSCIQPWLPVAEVQFQPVIGFIGMEIFFPTWCHCKKSPTQIASWHGDFFSPPDVTAKSHQLRLLAVNNCLTRISSIPPWLKKLETVSFKGRKERACEGQISA